MIPDQAELLILGLAAGGFLAGAIVPPANAGGARKMFLAGVGTGGVMKSMGGTHNPEVLAALILFTSLMAVVGTIIPTLRWRDRRMGLARAQIYGGGGSVLAARAFVIPIKGHAGAKGTYYEFRTEYEGRRGVWYVCDQRNAFVWFWKDAQSLATLPAAVPQGLVNNGMIVASGIRAGAMVVALIACLLGFILWVAKASR